MYNTKLFGKKPKQDNGRDEVVPKPYIDLDAHLQQAEMLFMEYSEMKKREVLCKNRRDEITKELQNLADSNQMWVGKTARFNQYALQRKTTEVLVMPKELNLEEFPEEYLKADLNKKKILSELRDNEELQNLGFEIEIKASYVPKGF